MRRAVTPEATVIVLDVTEAPNYYVVAFDADGSAIDIIDEFKDVDKAHAFAQELAKAHNLPMKVNEELFFSH